MTDAQVQLRILIYTITVIDLRNKKVPDWEEWDAGLTQIVAEFKHRGFPVTNIGG